MNITIDKDLHMCLQANVITTIPFGSWMKGTADMYSDRDLLHIIPAPLYLLTAPFNTDHQLQYRETDQAGKVIADNIYTTVPQFISALINGDTTINHEILRWDGLAAVSPYKIDGYPMEGLQTLFNDDKLNGYKCLRGYLGIAKRDIKDSKKAFTQKDAERGRKKLTFANDGIRYVADQLGYDLMTSGLDVDDHKHHKLLQANLLLVCSNLRDRLNLERKEGNIPYTVSPETLEKLLAIISGAPRETDFSADKMESCKRMLDYYFTASMDTFNGGN